MNGLTGNESLGTVPIDSLDFLWDENAAVWVATSKFVPGLVLESGSFDALLEKVRYAVPELKELNGIKHRLR